MMNQRRLLELKDKLKLEVVVLTYPISPDRQIQLIELLQQEWDRTDVDWLFFQTRHCARSEKFI